MIELYKHLKGLVSGPPEHFQTSTSSIQQGNYSVRKELEAQRVKVPLRRRKIPKLIEELYLVDPVTENIRMHRLEETTRLREQIEQRIAQLDGSIHALSPSLPKEVRSLSQDDIDEQIKRLSIERAFRKKLQRARLKEAESRIARRTETEKVQQEAQAQARLQERKEKVAAMHERSAERKAQLQKLGTTLKSGVRHQPLHIKYEQEFRRKVMLPMLNRCQREILKRHEYVNQVNLAETMSFAKEHDELLKTKAEARLQKFPPSPEPAPPSSKLKEIIDADRREFTQLMQREEDRKQLDLRMKRYANLVRQLYSPKKASKTSQVTPPPKEHRVSHSVIPRTEKPRLKKSLNLTEVSTTRSNGPDYLSDKRVLTDVKGLIAWEERATNSLLSRIKGKVSQLQVN